MVDLSFVEIRYGRQPNMRVRSHVDPLPCHKFRRAHLVEAHKSYFFLGHIINDYPCSHLAHIYSKDIRYLSASRFTRCVTNDLLLSLPKPLYGAPGHPQQSVIAPSLSLYVCRGGYPPGGNVGKDHVYRSTQIFHPKFDRPRVPLSVQLRTYNEHPLIFRMNQTTCKLLKSSLL